MGERKSILIVGHSESASKYLVQIFDQNGYTIETAGTGHDALEKAKRQTYTAAFLDTRLPDMEGTELVKALKDVQPDTVLRWHRAGFRLFWKCRSRPKKPGRPCLSPEIRDLI